MKSDYKIVFFRRLARYGDFFWKYWERNLLSKYSGASLKYSPVFIVGAPRTGSTLLYQLLTHYLDVLYIDNLTSIFYKHLLCGLNLSKIFFGSRSHNCFHSYQGDTNNCGLHAPSECGDFWYRWLPREKHFTEEDELSKESIEQIRKIIFSATNHWDKPLIFKNLNAGQRMRLIRRILPGAKFIFITREPLFTAQSIWEARKTVGVAENEWWSIMPENFKQLLKLKPSQMVAAQVFFLEKQILTDSKLFPQEQFFTVNYESLCKYPDKTLKQLNAFIGKDLKFRKHSKPFEQFKFEEIQKIRTDDFKKLKMEVAQYDWENYELN